MITFPDKPAPVIKHFLDQNKGLVYKYIMRKIKRGIKENVSSIDIFSHKNRIESIHRSEFEKTLNHAIVEFCKIEDYESAAVARKLLDKFYISNIIDTTKSDVSCDLKQKNA